MATQNLHLPKLGLTLDEYKDFELIKVIFKKFWKKRKNFTCSDIINFLKLIMVYIYKIFSFTIVKKHPYYLFFYAI